MEPDSPSTDNARPSLPAKEAQDHSKVKGDVSSSTPDYDMADGGERPIQIVNVDPETREFQLDVEALSSILLRDECREKPVCVISIAGDFRKGKSFLLNFLLRYLNANGESDWMSEKDTPLKGNVLFTNNLFDMIIQTWWLFG